MLHKNNNFFILILLLLFNNFFLFIRLECETELFFSFCITTTISTIRISELRSFLSSSFKFFSAIFACNKTARTLNALNSIRRLFQSFCCSGNPFSHFIMPKHTLATNKNPHVNAVLTHTHSVHSFVFAIIFFGTNSHFLFSVPLSLSFSLSCVCVGFAFGDYSPCKSVLLYEIS